MAETAEITIKAGVSAGRYWRDLWTYRELFLFLAWRDLLVRYKQTAVGIAWALLRPFLSMLALTLVFGRLAKLPSEGAPYAVFVFAALLPWQFFSSALSESGTSLLNNANLLSKVYFPRMIVPASAILTALMDFAISLVLLGGLMVWHQYAPSWRIVYLPVFLVAGMVAAAGAGWWAAALIIRYRDVRMIIPFVVQFGFFLSPVGYNSSLVPAQWRVLYYLNPVAGIIDGFRWSILREPGELFVPGLAVSLAVSILLFVSGALYFRRSERTLADVI